MKTRPLGRTGLQVSILSLGGSSLGRVRNPAEEAEAIRAVHAAFDLGINFVDTSPYYGATLAESVLGKALREIGRERYLVATKVGRYGLTEFDFSAARVVRSVEESCARLGVETIDLLQCHDIEFGDLGQIVEETLPALAKLRQAGRIRQLGITGLPLRIFPAVIDRSPPGTVETILSYCHYMLNDDSLAGLVPKMQAAGIGVINAAPTGMGLLTEAGPPAWHFAPPSIIAGCRRAVDFCRSEGVDIVKLAVQFSISHSGIATTLIGTAKSDEIRRDVAFAEEPSDAGLLARVRQTLLPIRNHNFSSGGRPENQDEPVPPA